MASIHPDGFYDLTPNPDFFELIPGLLSSLPGGLRGLEGDDQIIGSEVAEIINGNQDEDQIFGGGGNDILFGGRAADVLAGETGNDILSGNLEDDELAGNLNRDILYGGQGSDRLDGGEEDDILTGDLGLDTLIGGEDADIFVLRPETQGDIIFDFDVELDGIGLTADLTFENLTLEGTVDTRIQLKTSGELLGVVLGVAPVELAAEHFFTIEMTSDFLNSNEISTDPLFPTSTQINLETLPEPFASESASKPSQISEIPDSPSLQVPPGFQVNVFAENLDRPRWLAVTPTGDILVTETFENRIRLLRDVNGDGTADTSQVFADTENGVNIPFGMAFTEDAFYLGNTDAILKFPYQFGQTQLSGTGEKIADLPGGGYNQHWTRNLAISPDQQQLYVSVGSRSNAEPEPLPRASIQVMNLDGSNQQIFADGLRNPVGLDFHPITGKLYTTVNERDGLGDDLVPDYFTGLDLGEFYGWPYAYLTSDRTDPRIEEQRPDLVAKTQTPDVLFQAHSAPLGLQFYDGETFPEEYQNGAFVAFHGSWNRDQGTGYKVVFIPFNETGNPTGTYEDFLTGFLIDPSIPLAWGRPTGLQVIDDGSLLLTDDANNRIYRIQYESRG